MADDVAYLVVAAALHPALLPEDLAYGLAQSLRPVEDEQPRPARVQAALDEALQEPQRDDGVLARALPDAKDPLVALVVHAQASSFSRSPAASAARRLTDDLLTPAVSAISPIALP